MPTDVERLRVDTENFCALMKEALEAGLAFRFTAQGRSMRPTIHDGDVVTIVPLGERGLKTGDIVVHRAGAGGLVVHRVIRSSRQGLGRMLHTRGDASGGDEDLIEEEDILGRATQVERGKRRKRIDRLANRLWGLLWSCRQTLRYRVVSPSTHEAAKRATASAADPSGRKRKT